MHNLHMLTDITGKRSRDNLTRTRQSFEFKAATWRAIWISASVAFVLSAIISSAIGLYAVIVGMALFTVSFLLLTQRSKKGLQQNLFFTVMDKRKGATNSFYICGVPIDPAMAVVGTIRQATVPNPELVTSSATPADPWSDDEGNTP